MSGVEIGTVKMKVYRRGKPDQLIRSFGSIRSLHLVLLEQPNALKKRMGLGFRASHRPLDKKAITTEAALVFERITLLFTTSASLRLRLKNGDPRIIVFGQTLELKSGRI